ncbi:hypothetical protein [Streptomyces sp. G45]|uniref:hypothetical protein n=1 Tax=Streptomyces sp. G45 TaxID=3406627 RepID=UPI003C25AB1D
MLKASPERAPLAEQAGTLGWFAASGRAPAALAVDEEVGPLVLEDEPGTPAGACPAAGLAGQ